MVNPIPSLAPTPAVHQATARLAKADGPESATRSEPLSKTKVAISKAAEAALAASQEALETPAQSAQEARGGDRQAQRLFAQQAAAQTALTRGTGH